MLPRPPQLKSVLLYSGSESAEKGEKSAQRARACSLNRNECFSPDLVVIWAYANPTRVPLGSGLVHLVVKAGVGLAPA